MERVGRHDSFFELGGHSLMAVKLVERMRQVGLSTDVRALFTTSTLAELAQVVGAEKGEVRDSAESDSRRGNVDNAGDAAAGEDEPSGDRRVVAKVPGGGGNVQDIYPLAPLQEGILFHHMMGGEGDTYLLPTVLRFESRERLDRWVAVLELVDRAARHPADGGDVGGAGGACAGGATTGEAMR